MPEHDQESSCKPTLVGVVGATLRAKHYSPRTEEAYVGWIRRFIRFHQKRHPRTMGEHLGQPLDDTSMGNLCRLYVAYLQRMFDSFAPVALAVQDRLITRTT